MMYGNAVIMGLSPSDVDAMSLAQYLAAMDGWNRSQGGGGNELKPPTLEEYSAVVGR